MPDKKPDDRGVVDSIYALRIKRYNEKGPGAARKVKQPAMTKPAVLTKLRAGVAKVAKKKPKKRSRR